MITDERFAGGDITFMSFFEAAADKWTEVLIPFSELRPEFRGNPMPSREFDPKKLEEVGFNLNEVSYDKIPGDFKLEIQWVAAV